MHLLTGLGNPGARYAGNRHNIGFMVIDALTRAHGFSAPSQKFGGLFQEGRVGTHKVLAFRPLTFMNLSGQAVGEALRFYKLEPGQLIVFHDELDLPLGRLRVKQGGGSGGHNGLKSIDAHVGAEYWRVRLGIGHPGNKDLVTPYVLSDFPKDERAVADELIAAAAAHLPLLLDGDAAGYMNRAALAVHSDADKSPLTNH